MYTFNATTAQRWKLDSARGTVNEQPISDGTYTFTSGIKNNCMMDIAGGSLSDKANVQLYESNGTSAQRFEVSYIGGGYYKILAEKTAKSIDVANGATKSGANLWQYTSNGSVAQKWKFIDAGNGYYYIKSAKGTFIDVSAAKTKNGTNIQMYTLNGTKAQKWKLSSSNYRPIKEGEYVFKSGLNTMRAMEVSSNYTEDGANIQLGNLNYGDLQKYTVKYADDGYYRIYSTKSGKSLDVKGNSSAPETNLQQMSENQNDGQLWKFIEAGNGNYYIRSKLGTAIDVTGAKANAGVNIQLYNMNGTSAQKWKINSETLTSISGQTLTTAEKMAQYYNSKKKSYPYSSVSEAPTIEKFAQIYIEECNAEGIRAEVAFCQAMKETGWLQYGGDVKANQYNFAGIGATGGGKAGASFDSIRIGIRAHVQHLKAYANKNPLKNTCVDPRFNYVTRGTAPYVEWLGINANPYKKGWAPAADYGTSIVKMMREL